MNLLGASGDSLLWGAGVGLACYLDKALASTQQARLGCWSDRVPQPPALPPEKEVGLEPVSTIQLLCRVTNWLKASARDGSAVYGLPGTQDTAGAWCTRGSWGLR